MAPASLMRHAWIVAATLAAGFLAVLAFHGERANTSMAKFQPAGFMAHLTVTDVRSIEVLAGGKRWQFARGGDGRWSASAAPSALPPDLGARLDQALGLLRNAGAERVMTPEELGAQPLADFGLDPPRLSITVHAGASTTLSAAFGNANPIGLARYARISGQDGVALLPAYVVEAWEKAVEAPR